MRIGRVHREALIAEFMERQLWQFISIEEWLLANLKEKPEVTPQSQSPRSQSE